MARAGLYKSDIKKARDALLAQGKNPSLDAVRIALGNTGSKTTIHKYLKELEEENGGAENRATSISEALQDMVARLAAQLQEEANARIDGIERKSAENERQYTVKVAALQTDVDTINEQLQRSKAEVQKEAAQHSRTREALQQETIARHTAEQHAADLKDRLVENEAHRLSIEEKHQHAREALEHYRQSVKEQRDQDQRRHEQQVQQLQAEMRQLQQSLVVKQDDVTRLNQEGTRLIADLSNAQKAVYEHQTVNRQLEQRLEMLQGVELRCKMVEVQVAEKDGYAKELKSLVADAAMQVGEFTKQVHRLELELATANAKLEAQQAISSELRAYLEKTQPAKLVLPSNEGQADMRT